MELVYRSCTERVPLMFMASVVQLWLYNQDQIVYMMSEGLSRKNNIDQPTRGYNTCVITAVIYTPAEVFDLDHNNSTKCM